MERPAEREVERSAERQEERPAERQEERPLERQEERSPQRSESAGEVSRGSRDRPWRWIAPDENPVPGGQVRRPSRQRETVEDGSGGPLERVGEEGRAGESATVTTAGSATAAPAGSAPAGSAPAGSPADVAPQDRSDAVVTGATYGMLLVLGFVVGVYGAFYSSLWVGVVPVGVVAAVVANFVMCRAAGRMLRARLSGLVPAGGWVVAMVLLSSRRPEGDLIITGSRLGYMLLFGGTIAAALGASLSLIDGPRGLRERRGLLR